MGNVLSCFGLSKIIEIRKQKQMEKQQETIENSMTEYNKKYKEAFEQLELLYKQRDMLLLCSLITRNQTKKTELITFVKNFDTYKKASNYLPDDSDATENKKNIDEDSVSISEEDRKNKLKNKKSKQKTLTGKSKNSPQMLMNVQPSVLVIGGKTYTVEEVRSCLQSTSKSSRTSTVMLTNKHRSLTLEIRHKENEVSNIAKRLDNLFSDLQAITGGREMIEYGEVLGKSNKALKKNLAEISQANIQNTNDESRAIIESFNEVSSSLSVTNPGEEESLEDELRQFEQENIIVEEEDSVSQNETGSLFSHIPSARLEGGPRAFAPVPGSEAYSIDSEETYDNDKTPMIETPKKNSSNKKPVKAKANEYRQMVEI